MRAASTQIGSSPPGHVANAPIELDSLAKSPSSCAESIMEMRRQAAMAQVVSVRVALDSFLSSAWFTKTSLSFAACYARDK